MDRHSSRSRHSRRPPKFTAEGSHPPRRRGGRIEAAADVHGRPLTGSTFRRNGKLRYAADAHDPLIPVSAAPPERSMLLELRRRVAAEIARYRMSGLFSPKELRTIDALWTQGLSLREHARREGVAPQAIEARIQRLRHRAVRFWQWWRLKNRMRGRR